MGITVPTGVTTISAPPVRKITPTPNPTVSELSMAERPNHSVDLAADSAADPTTLSLSLSLVTDTTTDHDSNFPDAQQAGQPADKQ